MELRHLRYFVAAAGEENVSRAAQKLHVSQPGVSRQIRDLEQEIGFPLFERSAQALKLTAAGKIFLTGAKAVLQQAEEAVKQARVAAGGSPMPAAGSGYFFEPTLFVDADTTMRVAQEEIFGPVLTAIPFDDEADAIRKANDVQYGLTAYIWTNDLGRSLRVANAMEAGMV